MVPHNAFVFEDLTVSQNYSETERRNQLKKQSVELHGTKSGYIGWKDHFVA